MASKTETPTEIASAFAERLSAGVDSISRLGHFGSSIHRPKSKDIDILITITTPDSARDYAFDSEMSVIAERIAGNFSCAAPVDPYVQTEAQRIVDLIIASTGLPVVAGFGPAQPHTHEGLWIHLNGPVSDRCWEVFGRHFPLHAWTIRNNYRPLIGPLPSAGSIRGYDLLRYADLVERRLRSRPSYDYFTKLVKTLALIGGEQSYLTDRCLASYFAPTDPLRLAIAQVDPTRERSWMSLVGPLLRLIRIQGGVMVQRGIEYPQAWQ